MKYRAIIPAGEQWKNHIYMFIGNSYQGPPIYNNCFSIAFAILKQEISGLQAERKIK